MNKFKRLNTQRKHMKKRHVVIMVAYLAVSTGIAWAQTYGRGQQKKNKAQTTAVSFAAADVALEPTHLMMVPTTHVLQRNQYVLSFHECSFGIDNNIQIFFCPWDPKPGRVWLGGKFGLREDLAVGVGISDQYWYDYDYYDGYRFFHGPMLGLFGVKTLASSSDQVVYGLADLQGGSGFNVEVGAGIERTATQQVKLMGELALSSNWYDVHGHGLEMGIGVDLNLGLRYMVASLPQLKIDFGLNVKNYAYSLFPYIDVSYSSQIR
jgi:hypothetical protein